MYLYMFDEFGGCMMRVMVDSVEEAEQVFARNPAPQKAISHAAVSVNQARLINDQIVEVVEAPPKPSWVENRVAHYPPMQAQLDAIWHAMDKGLLPQIEGFYDLVADVKSRYPKE